MNYVKEYYRAIQQGDVVVSKKVERVYRFLVDQINDPQCQYIFDERKADHAIFFIEHFCKHSKGIQGGTPFLPQLRLPALIPAMFGFIDKDTGFRQFREVILIVARKNGKSTLGAAIGLYLMVADQEPGAEIYAAATKKDQAKIIWLEAKRMVKKSNWLWKKIKCLVAELVSGYNDSTFKPLGSDSDTLDGLNVHGALLDEVHAWKDRNLYDVIVDGCTARDQPMIFIVTTAGTIRECVFDQKYEECENILKGYDDTKVYNDLHTLPVVYELDNRMEWTNPRAWQKANPGLGTIKSEKQLREKVKKAQKDPKLVKNLLCKDFDHRETSSESWLEFDQLNNEATFDPQQHNACYAIGGADLSATTDLTSACVIYKLKGENQIYVLQMYWLPEDLLEKRVQEDKIPYDIWRDMGLLRTCPGNRVDYRAVTEWFCEIQDEFNIIVSWVGYDPWGAPYWKEEMISVFGDVMEDVRQGKLTLSNPMKEMEAEFTAKRINYNNNPVTKWCISNVAVDIDKNLNIQPCKTKNTRQRIDGFAALLDAYVVYTRHLEEYEAMVEDHIEE